MSAGSLQHAESGIRSYDGAAWTGEKPDVTSVVSDPNGMSTIYQVRHKTDTREIVEVAASAADLLLIWRFGACKVECWLDGRFHQLTLRPGTGVFVPVGCDTKWISDSVSSSHVMHLHFAPGLLADTHRDLKLRPSSTWTHPIENFEGQALSYLALSLFHEISDQPPEPLAWESWTNLALGQLARRLSDNAPKLYQGGLAPWQVRRVLEAIADGSVGTFGLAELAALVELSPFHFCRAFKRSVGVSPHQYQLMQRVERARVMLEYRQMTVTEIAHELGYNSSQAFARIFRQYTGMSPLAYRREVRR